MVAFVLQNLGSTLLSIESVVRPHMEIIVEPEVVDLITNADCDYRVCTACLGPALVPTSVKGPKSSDVQIPVGNHILYISQYVARYISRVTIDMEYDDDEIDACPAFPPRQYRNH